MFKQVFSLRDNNRKLIIKLGRTVIQRINDLIEKFSLVRNSTFFERDIFPWINHLESHWTIIREELEFVLKYQEHLPSFHEISPDQKRITQDNFWKTYFFYSYGIKAEENCHRCPQTTQLIKTIPGMKTAFFSILSPQKHIPEHCGPYKGVLRYHLALVTPKSWENCQIRVGNEIRCWQEGESLIFDDTFPHEVHNNTEDMRVVLFVDFARPMKFPFSVMNEIIINLISKSPFIQDVKTNQKNWDDKLKQVIIKDNTNS